MRGRTLLIGLAALVLVAVITSQVVLRRAAAGPVLYTVGLSGSPWAAALDKQTGHLFVVNRSFGGGFSNGGGGFSSSTLSSSGGGFQGGSTVSVLDTGNGALVRGVSAGADPRAVTVDPQYGLAYVTNDDDASVSVLDTRSGAAVHTIHVGARPHALVADAPTGRIFVVNTSQNTVSILDARRSTVLRVVHVPSAVDRSGAAVDTRTNRVFILGGGSVSVLDARSGALLHTISLDQGDTQGSGTEITQMAVDEGTGRVFALGAGFLNVIDAGTGRLLRTMRVSVDASALALDARHGHLLLARAGTQDAAGGSRQAGSVQVLDVGTGSVLRTISLGASPSALVVDERANHLIVVDSGGSVRVMDPWGWVPDGLRKRLPILPAPDSGTRAEPGSVTVLDLSRL